MPLNRINYPAGLALLGTAVVVCLSGCTGPGFFGFGVNRTARYTVSPGDQFVQLQLFGVNFTNQSRLIIDGQVDGIGTGITLNGPLTFVSSQELDASLNIAANAIAGAHTFVIGDPNEGISSSLPFYVQCSGCPAPPVFGAVHTIPSGQPLYPGTPTTVRFLGANFLNNSPAIHSLTPGLSVDPGATIVVQRDGDLDYFDVPVVVTASAIPGLASLQITTTGGFSNTKNLNVVANADFVSPPAPIPLLYNVTPRNVTVGAEVTIECTGSGFGVNHQVITDPPMPVTTYPIASGDSDRTVVAKIQAAVAGPIKVQVTNLDQGLTTDDIRIFADAPAVNVPAARNNDTNGVHRGGSYDLQISGIYNDARDHLIGATNSGWSGIPGLIFSNTVVSTSGGVTTVTVRVQAGATAPLTGDHATNLTLTTAMGESNPFLLRVLP